MINADTAIVKGAQFFHYCHNAKSWFAWRSYRKECPLCGCKNPRYVPKTRECFLVTDYKNHPIMAFTNYFDAIDYMQKYSDDEMMLGDVGLIEHVS